MESTINPSVESAVAFDCFPVFSPDTPFIPRKPSKNATGWTSQGNRTQHIKSLERNGSSAALKDLNTLPAAGGVRFSNMTPPNQQHSEENPSAARLGEASKPLQVGSHPSDEKLIGSPFPRECHRFDSHSGQSRRTSRIKSELYR